MFKDLVKTAPDWHLPINENFNTAKKKFLSLDKAMIEHKSDINDFKDNIITGEVPAGVAQKANFALEAANSLSINGITPIFEEFDDFSDFGTKQIKWKTLPAIPAHSRTINAAATTNRIIPHPKGIYMRLGQFIIRYDEDLNELARYTHIEAFAWVEIIGEHIFFLSAPQAGGGTGMQLCRLDLETLALENRSNTLHTVAQNNAGYFVTKYGVYFRTGNEIRRWDLFTHATTANTGLAVANYTIMANCYITRAGVYIFYFFNEGAANTVTNNARGLEFRRFNLNTLVETGSRTLLLANTPTANNRQDFNNFSHMRIASDFGFCFHTQIRARNDANTVLSNTQSLMLVSVRENGTLTTHTINSNTVGNPTTFVEALFSTDGKTVMLTWLIPNTAAANVASNTQRITAIWRFNPDIPTPVFQTQLQANIIHVPIGMNSYNRELIPYDPYDNTFGDYYYLDGLGIIAPPFIPRTSRDMQDIAEILMPWGINYPIEEKRNFNPQGRVAHTHAGSPNIGTAFYYKKNWYVGVTQFMGKLPKGLRLVGYEKAEVQ